MNESSQMFSELTLQKYNTTRIYFHTQPIEQSKNGWKKISGFLYH